MVIVIIDSLETRRQLALALLVPVQAVLFLQVQTSLHHPDAENAAYSDRNSAAHLCTGALLD